jgi:hypothetical protein
MDATIGAGLPTAAPAEPRTTFATGALAVPAIASLGAGAIHAAAMGVHNEHDQAVLTFAIAAAFQLAWGVVALTSNRKWIAIIGAVGNAALVGGWIMAKTSGIGFVDGLEEAESAQFADTVAAALAAVAVLGVLGSFTSLRSALANPLTVRALTLPIAVISVVAMVSAATGHTHAAGAHGHGDTAAMTDGHAHADPAAATDGHAHTAAGGGGGGNGGAPHGGHDTAVVKAFDPDEPIDLAGVEGVSPQQQAQAENLLAATLRDLPRWSDPAVAEAEGWHSIGDGVTGYEHYINLSLFSDGRILDPDYPESLVYQLDRASGKKQLVAAMFMLETGATLDDVPDFGGKLMQWHIHNNLCFTAGENPRVAGLTNDKGECPPGLAPGSQAPMVHVWIRSHECGPFAALEGVAGGQIKDGEKRWCDHAHGAGH